MKIYIMFIITGVAFVVCGIITQYNYKEYEVKIGGLNDKLDSAYFMIMKKDSIIQFRDAVIEEYHKKAVEDNHIIESLIKKINK